MSDVRLIGTLARDARLLVTTDGHAYIEAQVQQRHSGRATALWRLGQGPAAQYAAGAKARRMRAGLGVTVYAHGYQIDSVDPGMHLVGVDCIELHADTTALLQHSEPTPPKET